MASEKEYWQYSTSVSKALNMVEAPLKLKHARYIIITTHHLKECNSLWRLLSSQPLMENRFTAWKFCHLLHKVLREGHRSAIQHSQSHKKMLIEMGKLWGHLDDLGTCIQAYSKLLVTKLDFHEKNAFSPGSLAVSFKDIDKYAGNDINVYFQLCVEIFDYLDDILAVQAAVFNAVNTFRMFSMSSPAQCRLAPLITLIQDSNPLYDFCVRIMFKLHDNLPSDILSGHRSRFKEIFSKLKAFYEKVRPLQYFEDLIQVPHLPETAPNFSSEVDFGNYIPPVLKVPEPEPKPELENLVDLSLPPPPPKQQQEVVTDTAEKVRYEQLLYAKELALEKIEDEFMAFRENYNATNKQHRIEINELLQQINSLKEELKCSKLMCEKMQEKIADTPVLIQKTAEMEEKTKQQEEKFNKFKAMYSEIREEHIKLLRQNGETNKLLNQEKKLTQNLQKENDAFKKELNDLRTNAETSIAEKNKLEKLIEKSTTEILSLQKECIELKAQIDYYKELEGSNSKEISETLNILKQKTEEINQSEAQKMQLEKELTNVKSESEKKIIAYTQNIARINSDLDSKINFIEELKVTHSVQLNEKNSELQQIRKELETFKQQLEQKDFEYKQLAVETEKKIQIVNELNKELEVKHQQAINDAQQILQEKNTNENKNMQFIIFILNSFINSSCAANALTFNKTEQLTDRSFYLLKEINKNINLIDDMQMCNYLENENIQNFLKTILTLLNYLNSLQEVCDFTYRTTTDIENGEKLCEIMRSLCEPIQNYLSSIEFKNSSHNISIEKSSEPIKAKLQQLDGIFRDLTKTLHSSLELADIIENELKTMEATIAEASEKFLELLTHTKSKYDGIQLEVNEKILDACTNLMECIKRLIKKSKTLQEEIVSSGRGNVSAREFYKRNSEWTEGLISAAKSIAKGANFLVEAANKAVSSGTSQNMEIIVAAQEIAACTAQLVIASKVKASKNSLNLQELTKESRSVSQATGAVVAIVKDSNERIEQFNDIDICKLTASQAKTMEMNIQVKVLELEQALQTERFKLSSFRKNLYKNSDN